MTSLCRPSGRPALYATTIHDYCLLMLSTNKDYNQWGMGTRKEGNYLLRHNVTANHDMAIDQYMYFGILRSLAVYIEGGLSLL